MRDEFQLVNHLQEALDYLYNQEQKLKPYLDILNDLLIKKVKEEELSAEQVFKMYTTIQNQYTDSILLIAKVKEILDFKD